MRVRYHADRQAALRLLRDLRRHLGRAMGLRANARRGVSGRHLRVRPRAQEQFSTPAARRC